MRYAPLMPSTEPSPRRMIPESETTTGLYRRIRESGIDLNDPANWTPITDFESFIRGRRSERAARHA